MTFHIKERAMSYTDIMDNLLHPTERDFLRQANPICLMTTENLPYFEMKVKGTTEKGRKEAGTSRLSQDWRNSLLNRSDAWPDPAELYLPRLQIDIHEVRKEIRDNPDESRRIASPTEKDICDYCQTTGKIMLMRRIKYATIIRKLICAMTGFDYGNMFQQPYESLDEQLQSIHHVEDNAYDPNKPTGDSIPQYRNDPWRRTLASGNLGRKLFTCLYL